jgi:hypothetical protein
MFSPVELRNCCPDTCRNHRIKECVTGTGKSRPCPMFVTPITLDRNNYCNFCGECVKSCSQNNIAVRFRSFGKDIWTSAKGSMDEAFLAMVLVGLTIIMTGEMVEPWHRWMDAVGKMLPLDILGLKGHAAAEKATFTFVLLLGSLILPAVLLFLFAGIANRLAGVESTRSIRVTAVSFAYMFIPVGLSMHLAHNVSHLFKEGPGIVPAVKRLILEISGIRFGMHDWEITPLMGSESILLREMAILAAFKVFAHNAGDIISVRF